MNVEKNVVEREVPVIETVKEETYVIELNYEEACALQAVLGNVGGRSPGDDNNPRVTTDAIYYSLAEQGLNYMNEDVKRYQARIVTNMCVGVKGS